MAAVELPAICFSLCDSPDPQREGTYLFRSGRRVSSYPALQPVHRFERAVLLDHRQKHLRFDHAHADGDGDGDGAAADVEAADIVDGAQQARARDTSGKVLPGAGRSFGKAISAG
jgi:hypothetical protein